MNNQLDFLPRILSGEKVLEFKKETDRCSKFFPYYESMEKTGKMIELCKIFAMFGYVRGALAGYEILKNNEGEK